MVKCRRCRIKYSTFNLPGMRPEYCADCKTDEMVDVMHRRCAKCHIKQCYFNLVGLKPEYCADCKTEDMIDVKNIKCAKCHIKQPTYNLIGKSPKYCSVCKTDDMIDVRNKKCIHNRYNCWACDPVSLVSSVCRARIKQAFKDYKDIDVVPDDLLCASYDVIYDHINKQIKPDMTYKNYGKLTGQWNFDHIIPITYNYPTILEMKERCHYTNLQPLFNNNKKGNNLLDTDVDLLLSNYDNLSPSLQQQLDNIISTGAPIYELVSVPTRDKLKQRLKLKLKKNVYKDKQTDI